MRHRVRGRHLGRTSAHRRALRRNMAASLFEHGTIATTKEKAKFVKPFAERLITLARKGSLHARRRAVALLKDRDICVDEQGEPVKQTTVIQKLFSEIGPAYADRPGGYTRIVRMPLRRQGDNGELVLLQLVTDDNSPYKTRKKKAPGARPTAGVTGPSDSAVATVEPSEPATDQQDESQTAVEDVPADTPEASETDATDANDQEKSE